jgi:predicted peroxiredoxin
VSAMGAKNDMSRKLIFVCTHGKEDPERATLPFVAANVAATAGQEAIVVCTIEAVRLGTKQGSDGIESKGLPPLAKLFGEFVANGGSVWLCGACTKPRGIVEEQLAKGATIVGAARIVEEIVAGATPTSFA